MLWLQLKKGACVLSLLFYPHKANIQTHTLISLYEKFWFTTKSGDNCNKRKRWQQQQRGIYFSTRLLGRSWHKIVGMAVKGKLSVKENSSDQVYMWMDVMRPRCCCCWWWCCCWWCCCRRSGLANVMPCRHMLVWTYIQKTSHYNVKKKNKQQMKVWMKGNLANAR